MHQACVQAPGRLELLEVPIPTPAEGELVIRVDLALTCGTDLKTYRRGHPKIPMPTPLGHEATGTVARVGAGVSRFREGDAVMLAPSAPCGVCPPCTTGLENLCDRIDGTTMAWGAFADYLRVPAHVVRRNVFLRPRGVSLVQAAFLEPLACVVNGRARLDLGRADTVVVLGAGVIGLLFVLALKQAAVPRVVVLGRRAPRLAAARACGADVVLDLDGGLEAVRDALGPGAATVVECVGRPEAWSLAVDLARKGGEVLLFGGCPAGAEVRLSCQRLHYDALTLKGAFHFTPSDVRIALDAIRSGRLPLEQLVSGRFALHEIGDAFRALDRGEHLKLAVVPAAEDA